MNNVSMSHEWNRIHEGKEWGRYPSEPVIRFVARNYYKAERDKVKILDFGCGQGAHTWYLAREGFDTYAFDGAEAAVIKAKEYLQRDHLKAQIEVMDGLGLAYPDDFFDAVIDSFCIGHNELDDIIKMYKRINCCLKKGGRLFSSFFSSRTTGYGTGELIEKGTYKNVTSGPLENVGIVHFWEKDEMESTVEQSGFHDIKIEEYYHTDMGSDVDMYILTAIK